MSSALTWLDWILVAVLILVVSGAALVTAVMLLRRYTRSQFLDLQSEIRFLKLHLARLERQKVERQPPPAAPLPGQRTPPSPPERPSRPIPDALATVGVRSMETLTQDAAAALASLDAYRRFAQAAGGSGFVVAPGTQNCQPVSGNDPVSASDLWAVPFEGGVLYFPGFNLRRSQSALLANAGRMARDRLGWLFDIEAGEQLAAFKPAIQRPGEDLERGLLTLPF